MYNRTEKQKEALGLLGSDSRYMLLYGGSRSGKTFVLIEAIITRALKLRSRHLILRQHFNHVKQSVWLDTLPRVMDVIWPGLKGVCKWKGDDYYVILPNKSEIWIGGLDDNDRTEKILGKEYSTIFFNECSQNSYESINIALTRLAEKNQLKKRAYFDCNPPRRSHWSYSMFIDLKDPITGLLHGNLNDYQCLLMNPMDNAENIDSNYIEILDKLPPLLRARFKEGQWVSDDKDIFKNEWIVDSEKYEESDLVMKVTFVDPANTSKELASESTCESAIVTLGVTYEGIIHELETLHGMWSYKELKDTCVIVHNRHKNVKNYLFGIEDVGSQKWLASDLSESPYNIPCTLLKPIADKVTRAVAVTDIMAEGRCRVNDQFLRKQLLEFPGDRLKDCVDAYVHALTLVKKSFQVMSRPVDKMKDLDSVSKLFWTIYEKEKGLEEGNPHFFENFPVYSG